MVLTAMMLPGIAQETERGSAQTPRKPWMDKSLSPDKRAELLIEQMTLDEKIHLVHGGTNYEGPESPIPPGSLGGAGWIPGIVSLGIPDLQMTDGRSGVANAGHLGRYATALPTPLLTGSSWDLDVAYEFGSLLGKETRDLGFHVSLGATANLIREPRNGRNYECLSEDPILIGKMLGQLLKGTQDQGVIGNINRYATNDQETGRDTVNVMMDLRSLRETDLLAFEIAIKESAVGTVMCAYNRINGDYCCENNLLLNDILKNSWGFKGWIMSDWWATHSARKSALAGLDQEMPTGHNFGKLKAEVENGRVPMARLNDMVHRILRTMFSFGVFDNPPVPRPVNPFTGAEVAQRIAERGIVLLKNAANLLPLDASRIGSLAVIGSHADAGVLSGWGSNQVSAPGGNAVPGAERRIWHPSSPLKAIRAKAPKAKVEYDPGTDFATAAKLAVASDAAIVFVWQHTNEGGDVVNLSLPENQDQLVAQIAAANRNTIVVLETGGPVTMPWLGNVSAVLEAWYPGIRGGEAIVNLLFGEVNPSGKLPVTFPKSESDLSHITIEVPPSALKGATSEQTHSASFDLKYSEGLKVGYKWFDAEKKEPLFPFGFGLSYTAYSYSRLRIQQGEEVKVTFEVTNLGQRAGIEIAQVYATFPPEAAEPPQRLVAWEKADLQPGATKVVTLTLDLFNLSIFNVAKNDWELVPGEYKLLVGGSSRSTPLSGTIRIAPVH